MKSFWTAFLWKTCDRHIPIHSNSKMKIRIYTNEDKIFILQSDYLLSPIFLNFVKSSWLLWYTLFMTTSSSSFSYLNFHAVHSSTGWMLLIKQIDYNLLPSWLFLLLFYSEAAIGEVLSRYTNADLKISLYVCIHIKTVPWKFRVLIPQNSRVISRKGCEMYMYKYTEKIEYVKK